MSQGIQVVGLYVRDQDEALAFYVEKLGFRVHTDVRNGDYRWLTVQQPDQPSFQLGLFAPQPPTLDAATVKKAVTAAEAITSPASDGRGPAAYRTKMAGVMLTRALARAKERAGA